MPVQYSPNNAKWDTHGSGGSNLLGTNSTGGELRGVEGGGSGQEQGENGGSLHGDDY